MSSNPVFFLSLIHISKEFPANPKAGLCFQEKGNSVVLTGEVEIIEDAATKQEMWQEWFSAHFNPSSRVSILLLPVGVASSGKITSVSYTHLSE